MHELLWSQLFGTLVNKHKRLQCFLSPYWKLALLCFSFCMVFCFVLLLVWFGFFLPHSFSNATERALLRKDQVKSTKKKKKIQVIILQHFIVIQNKIYDGTFALQMS